LEDCLELAPKIIGERAEVEFDGEDPGDGFLC